MLEATARAGLGRLGKFSPGQAKAQTPNILFVSSERFPAPEFAEILLLGRGAKNPAGKPAIADAGSWLSAGESPAAASPAIPAQVHYPAAFSPDEPETVLDKIIIARENSPVPGNAELVVFANAAELLAQPAEFAARLVSLKEKAGYGKPIYAPGLGTPEQLSVLALFGIDLFDSAPLIAHARAGNFLFPSGAVHKGVMAERSCHCPPCILSAEKKPEFGDILFHNCHTAYAELKHVRNAIRRGNLRELAELRSRSSPELVALLRNMDLRHYGFVEKFTAVTGGPIYACGKESFHRPEIMRWRERVMQRWQKPASASVLLLIPCSARKPYSLSKTHRAFREALLACGNPDAVQEVVVTSPLGLVPRELENFYPANSYDIPVTGHWDEDEKKMLCGMAAEIIEKSRFKHIVLNLGQEMEFLADHLRSRGIEFANVCIEGHRPASAKTCALLSETLQRLFEGIAKPGGRAKIADEVRSMLRLQFGEFGESLAEGAQIRGRFPFVKVMRGAKQVCMFSPDRNMFALTPEGGADFLGSGAFVVKIGDFVPHGDIMAVGIESADTRIRPGDEVVVADSDGKTVVGTGIARMSAEEMRSSRRGAAVKMRALSPA